MLNEQTQTLFEKYNKKYRSRRKRNTTLILFFIIIFLIVGILCYINFIVNPIILSIGEAKVKSLATKAVNSAVSEVLFDNYTYDDIITIKSNEQGEITLIQANSLIINKLSRDLASVSQTKLDIIGEQGIGIQLGTLLGIPIFMGKGPEIRLKLNPIGSISCTFSSYFTQAGINQTNHKIYVNINSNLSVVLPITSKQVNNNSQILICESVLVGKVPDVYLNSNSLDNMLDLIP